MFLVRSEYSLKNFQGCCLLFNYQGSCLLSQATAIKEYHISCRLSTTFLIFFVVFRVTSTLLRFVSRDSYIRLSQLQLIVNNYFNLFYRLISERSCSLATVHLDYHIHNLLSITFSSIYHIFSTSHSLLLQVQYDTTQKHLQNPPIGSSSQALIMDCNHISFSILYCSVSSDTSLFQQKLHTLM